MWYSFYLLHDRECLKYVNLGSKSQKQSKQQTPLVTISKHNANIEAKATIDNILKLHSIKNIQKIAKTKRSSSIITKIKDKWKNIKGIIQQYIWNENESFTNIF